MRKSGKGGGGRQVSTRTTATKTTATITRTLKKRVIRTLLVELARILRTMTRVHLTF